MTTRTHIVAARATNLALIGKNYSIRCSKDIRCSAKEPVSGRPLGLIDSRFECHTLCRFISLTITLEQKACIKLTQQAMLLRAEKSWENLIE